MACLPSGSVFGATLFSLSNFTAISRDTFSIVMVSCSNLGKFHFTAFLMSFMNCRFSLVFLFLTCLFKSRL